ncbi:MAG: AF1514 family protein [Thiobacillaceae bacterium]|jgi:hypothetical protein
MEEKQPEPACPLPRPPDFSGVNTLKLLPDPSPADYRAAMELAKAEAGKLFEEPMLLSWYDRDRNFEAPQHVSECHQLSATPGYVDYGLNHGARLMIDIETGRFVFFYRDAFQL